MNKLDKLRDSWYHYRHQVKLPWYLAVDDGGSITLIEVI